MLRLIHIQSATVCQYFKATLAAKAADCCSILGSKRTYVPGRDSAIVRFTTDIQNNI